MAFGLFGGRALRNFHRPPMMSTKGGPKRRQQETLNTMPDFRRVTDAGQPASAEIEAAAKAAGLTYAHVPVRGGPTPEQVEQVRQLVAGSDGPVLAFCRSGTRSIVTWSIGQAASGAASPSELVQQGREAGYDLSGVLGA